MSEATDQADKAKEIIHDAIFEGILEIAIAAAEAQAPWLKAWVVSQVFRFLMTKMAGYFYEPLAKLGFFNAIDNVVGEKKDAYDKSINDLAGELVKPASEQSRDAIEKAKLEVQRRLKEMVQQMRPTPKPDSP